jgi:hypothetical protein
MHPVCVISFPPLPGYLDAMGFTIDTGYPYMDAAFPAPPVKNPQIIPAAATDLTDMQSPPSPYKRSQAADADRVTAKPGIDKIQFQHISLDIRKGQSFAIQQFLFIASL